MLAFDIVKIHGNLIRNSLRRSMKNNILNTVSVGLQNELKSAWNVESSEWQRQLPMQWLNKLHCEWSTIKVFQDSRANAEDSPSDLNPQKRAQKFHKLLLQNFNGFSSSFCCSENDNTLSSERGKKIGIHPQLHLWNNFLSGKTFVWKFHEEGKKFSNYTVSPQKIWNFHYMNSFTLR